MLSSRQKQLLVDVIENHIATTEPVGSKFLADKKGWDISSATLRNEMAALEKAGMLVQPHISAGRTPTEEGYCFYRDNFFKEARLSKNIKKELDTIIKQTAELDYKIKLLARTLARTSAEAVIVAFGKQHTYYTGLSNLLEQPEFFRQEEIYDIVNAMDNCEFNTNEFLQSLTPETQILIGSENPFISFCSLVVAPFKYLKDKGFIAILGPMRMNYNKNYSLVNYCDSLLPKI